MILHVADTAVFIPPFIDLVNENFDPDNHFFWLDGGGKEYSGNQYPNVYLAPRAWKARLAAYSRLCSRLHAADKIILHGLFNWRIIILLSAFPWILKKCHWVIWGADLYVYQQKSKSLKHEFLNYFRKRVLKRVGYLLTYVSGDVELAREWFSARGVHQYCLMYLSNVYQPLPESKNIRPQKSHINVMVGNSASPTNNHLEVFQIMSAFREDRVRIFSPLAYGDMNYAKEVVASGRSIFGDRFEPMFDFMSIEKYRDFLSTIDIAIFNHRRQQAMGNTIALLGAGKTVFLRLHVSHGRMLSALGLKLFDISELGVKLISEEQARNNIEIIKSVFSRDRLIAQWADIFEERCDH